MTTTRRLQLRRLVRGRGAVRRRGGHAIRAADADCCRIRARAGRTVVQGRHDLAVAAQQLGAGRGQLDRRGFARSHLGAAPAAIDSPAAAGVGGSARAGIRRGGNAAGQLGRTRRGPRLARARARHLRGHARLRVDQRQRRVAEADGPRQRRRHDPEVHAGWEAGDADRQTRAEQRQHRHDERAAAGRRVRARAHQRAVRRRRLRQPARGRLRRRQRQVQAVVGRLRQDAAGGSALAIRPRPRRIRWLRRTTSSSGSCTR